MLVQSHGAEVLQRQKPNWKGVFLSHSELVPFPQHLGPEAATPVGISGPQRRMIFVWRRAEPYPQCSWLFL